MMRMRDDAGTLRHASMVRVLTFAEALWAEDEAAAAVCPDILSGPSVWWPQRLSKTPGAHTAGMVRELLRRMPPQLEREPLDAFWLTKMARSVADALDPADYPTGVVLRVRAQALRDHATVLSHMARYREALEHIERASRLYEELPFADFELARLMLSKACALRMQDRAMEGVSLAREAAQVFVRLGERGRHVAARMIEAALLHDGGAFERALDGWLSLQQDPFVTELDRIRLAHNIATCYCDLGRPAEAIEPLRRCVEDFERLEIFTERTRSRWKLGVALLGTGRIPESIAVLRKAWYEFGTLALPVSAALTALDMADAMLASGKKGEVQLICQEVIACFTRAQMPERAIAALSLLREAAAVGRVSRELVRRTQATVLREGRMFVQPPE